MSIEAALEGIAKRLDSIEGLRTSAIKDDQINPPMAIVGVPPVTDYDEALARGKFQIQPTITVLVSAALDRIGQLQLAGFADLTGPSSIPAAIEADRTLGGAVEDIKVQSFRPLGMQEVGLIGYYGGLFTTRVLMKAEEI